MIELKSNEARVLGVLIEKAQTTPGQYPMTLNSLVAGCNQKSARDPVMHLNEDQVLEALDGLRSKNLVREVMMSGSRVEKFRHIARDTLEVSTSELVLLAELLLRGPQTAGELRSRATRMHPMESIEAVESVLQHLMQREEPMVQKLAPAPGSRAPRHAQLLCPKLHPLHPPEARTAPSAAPTAEAGDLAARVQRLESDVEALRAAVRALAEALGSDDPFAEGSSGS